MKTEITKEQIYSLSTESFGMIPGVIREMAERSAPLAYLYVVGTQTMEQSSLTDLEINAIELKISILNKCTSCVKGHSFLVKKAGLSDEDVNAIVNKEDTSISRLNVLLKATEYIYYNGNSIYTHEALDYFDDKEIPQQVVFEIIGLIALKTISSYVNKYSASINARAKQVALADQ